MQYWLKSWLGPLLLILGVILCGSWWVLVFTEKNTKKLIVNRTNKPDTVYLVVPNKTKYFIEKEDTTYFFYNKKDELVFKFKASDYKK